MSVDGQGQGREDNSSNRLIRIILIENPKMVGVDVVLLFDNVTVHYI